MKFNDIVMVIGYMKRAPLKARVLDTYIGGCRVELIPSRKILNINTEVFQVVPYGNLAETLFS